MQPASVLTIDELFRRERDGILRMCRSLVGNHHDAEEATQEAFSRVACRLGALHGEPGAYLNVVARRVCREFLRTSARTLPLNLATPAAEAGPEEAAIRRQSLRQSWSRLSSIDRDLIAGSFAGYSYEEIAARVGVSAKAVSVGLHRARSRARRVALESAPLLPA
jgi:RNA polymerase sigma factor (sigma-70 family)